MSNKIYKSQYNNQNNHKYKNTNQNIGQNQYKQDEGNWDLNSLYSAIDAIEITNDKKWIAEESAKFAKQYQNRVETLNSEELYNAITQFENLAEKLAKLSAFAYLRYTTNLDNEKITGFYQNINDFINNITTKLLFFELELIDLDEKKLEEDYKISENLKKYQSYLAKERLFRPYKLSQKEEEILNERNITANDAWIRLFDQLSVDLEFQFDDKILTLTEIFEFLNHKDESIRAKAASEIARVFKQNVKIFAYIINILVKDKEIIDSLRKFKTPSSYRNLTNFIEDEVVEIISDTIVKNYEHISHRYYKLKAKILQKEYLNYWDRNAPYLDESDEKYSFEQAKELVLAAYADFSPAMAAIGEKFFKNRWIDIYPKKGKDSGAFSHPTVPSANPYIMLNFQGKVNDVMTLAHELGHGVHQYLSSKQGLFLSETPLTLAETASIFGEQLTFEKLLKMTKDDSRKLSLISHKIEDSINTIIRQIAFFQFEKKLHDQRRVVGELTIDQIGKIWMEIQSESLGSAIKLNDDYQYYWMYISHFFHAPFYVYSYAFGNCLVNSLFNIYRQSLKTDSNQNIDQILAQTQPRVQTQNRTQGQVQSQTQDFTNKYIKLLELGGKLKYDEALKPFGINTKTQEFWQSGLNYVIYLIDEFEKLLTNRDS